GAPFGLVLFVSHLVLRLGVVGYSIGAIVLLAVTFLLMRGWLRRFLPGTKNCQLSEEESRRIFKYSAWFSLSILLSQISMFVMYLLSGRPTGSDFAILSILCTSGVLISNHVVAIRYHTNPRQAIVGSLVAAALLLVAADQFSPLSLRVMGHFGL